MLFPKVDQSLAFLESDDGAGAGAGDVESDLAADL
jgi:hypothetical protein